MTTAADALSPGVGTYWTEAASAAAEAEGALRDTDWRFVDCGTAAERMQVWLRGAWVDVILDTQQARLIDLRERMTSSAQTLDQMSLSADGLDGPRLRGKAEGVRLAMSYLDEVLRG